MNPSDLRVLVVDDDPAMLRLLSRWLEKAGYPVRTASDGLQALAAIEAACPDVVITDWEMPQMNGLELCQAVRGLRLPHYVHIVFLTVRSSQSEIVAGLEVGADDFLTKPVHQGEMLARLQAAARVLELERKLSLMARTDPLTGLFTQRSFYELLEREWQRSKRCQLPLSCVMMDLDFFKRINDIHGHPAGDVVLKTVAELLTKNCRSTDIVCRYGGEEFCIALPETSERDAALWADRFRVRLASQNVDCGSVMLRVTGSFGVAQRSEDTRTAEALVDTADQALLGAKRAGRDRVVCYQSISDGARGEATANASNEGFFQGINACHVMTPLVACLRADETIGRAVDFFLRTRINSTPVVGDDERLVGMISERDIMAAMTSLDLWEQPLREIMRPNVISYAEDTPIRIIYEFLCRVSLRRVVIVRSGYPVGTISRATLLRWYRNLITARGLRGIEGEAASLPEDDTERSRQRLAETARELMRQATQLERRFGGANDDLLPYVVGGATGMQELCNDLLANARAACDSSGTAALAAGMLIEGSHAD